MILSWWPTPENFTWHKQNLVTSDAHLVTDSRKLPKSETTWHEKTLLMSDTDLVTDTRNLPQSDTTGHKKTQPLSAHAHHTIPHKRSRPHTVSDYCRIHKPALFQTTGSNVHGTLKCHEISVLSNSHGMRKKNKKKKGKKEEVGWGGGRGEGQWSEHELFVKITESNWSRQWLRCATLRISAASSGWIHNWKPSAHRTFHMQSPLVTVLWGCENTCMISRAIRSTTNCLSTTGGLPAAEK